MKLRVIQIEKGFIVQRKKWFWLDWQSLNYRRTLKEIVFGYEVAHVFLTEQAAIEAATDLINYTKPKKKVFNSKVIWSN